MSPAAPTPDTIDEHLVTLHRRASREMEQYKDLRYALEVGIGGNRARVIAVTSPAVADGKSTTAVNLAGVMAHRHGARVLLVDMDLRRPSVGPMLGIADDAPGFVDAVVNPDLTLDSVVRYLSAFNLSVLTAGKLTDDPFELLRTSRAAEVLQQARRGYEFVVLDTSPLLVVPDTRILESWVDGFLLVVAAHRTPRKLVAEALRLINRSKLIGLVFNRDDQALSGQYGYDDMYGYGYGSSQRETKNGPRWFQR